MKYQSIFKGWFIISGSRGKSVNRFKVPLTSTSMFKTSVQSLCINYWNEYYHKVETIINKPNWNEYKSKYEIFIFLHTKLTNIIDETITMRCRQTDR